MKLQREARTYPGYLLPRGGTALALFAAGFHGGNDAIHFLRHNMVCDCVDTDAEKLEEMADLYPDGWRFHIEDAWEFASRAFRDEQEWDVVSVDPFLGDAAERAWKDVYLWTSLARHLVTLTVSSDGHLNVPEGWDAEFFPRSSRAAWMVMQRAE